MTLLYDNLKIKQTTKVLTFDDGDYRVEDVVASQRKVKSNYWEYKFYIGEDDNLKYRMIIVNDRRTYTNKAYGNYSTFYEMSGEFDDAPSEDDDVFNGKPRYSRLAEVYVGEKFDETGLAVKPYMTSEMVYGFNICKKE